MPSLRATTAAALRVVRRWPPLHAVVHAIAVAMTKTRWGERFVRSVVGAQAQTDAEYRGWIDKYDTLSDEDRDAIRRHIDRLARKPLISVVTTCWRSDLDLLNEAVASVRAQLYPHWELCIADDGSPGEAVWAALQGYGAADPRIKVMRRERNGGIAAATNSALSLATGEFVAFLDHDDLLAERALYEVAAELEAHPDADLIYSDEDKIDERGRRSQPHHKTDWNAELMLGVNAVNHLTVIRRALLQELGGLREGFDGAQDHDLILRASERTRRIRHIPWVLYHWRWQGRQGSYSRARLDQCAEAARRAVQDHLDRTGQAATAKRFSRQQGWISVLRAQPDPPPLVSIIVPTRDRAELVAQVAEGVLGHTGYAPLELIIVDNGSEEPATIALFERLRADSRVRILPAPGPFNFAALNNLAAREAKGEVLLLLNNDISVREFDHWLGELVAQTVRPNVGAVGAKLYYPDGTLQHAGVVLGTGGGPDRVAGHLYAGAHANHPGYQGCLVLARNVSAVTAACLAIRKAVWNEVGGMDEADLPVAFNDIDLCLKVRAAGYDIVWTPHAELVHHESASRGSDLAPEAAARFAREVAVMRERWGPVLDADPFYGPVFDKRFTNYRLGDPPDRVAPWVRSDSPR